MKESDNVEVRSFRLSKSSFDTFQHAAGERHASVNTAINELIADYVEYTLPMSQLKPLYMPSSLVRLLSETIPKEKMVEIAREFANDPIQRGLLIETKGDFTPESVLGDMKSSARRNFYTFTKSEHPSSSGKSMIILMHDAGVNWSIFLANYWKELLSSAGLKVSISTDENAAIFEFERHATLENSQNESAASRTGT